MFEQPCGCIVEYEGDQFRPDYSVDWCSLHAAASDLLAALQNLVSSLREGMAGPFDLTSFPQAEAAVRKALNE